jgi:hypothetical protein
MLLRESKKRTRIPQLSNKYNSHTGRTKFSWRGGKSRRGRRTLNTSSAAGGAVKCSKHTALDASDDMFIATLLDCSGRKFK